MKKVLGVLLGTTTLLSACGGGGSSQPIFGGSALSADEQTVLDELNQIRIRAGVDMVVNHPLLNVPAQKHAAYVNETNEEGFVESKTSAKYFTGASPEDRLNSGIRFNAAAEAVTRSSGSQATSALADMVSQPTLRMNLLQSRFTQAGIGLVQKQMLLWYDPWLVQDDLSIFMGTQTDLPQPNPSALTVWPIEGQTVPGGYNSDKEKPDLMPAAGRVGYPITVQVDMRLALDVTSFTLVKVGSTTTVPATVITHANNAAVPAWGAVLMPNAPLEPGASYVATFHGSSSGEPVAKTWTIKAQQNGLAVDRASVAPDEYVTFTVSGLDATEKIFFCPVYNNVVEDNIAAVYLNTFRKVEINRGQIKLPATNLCRYEGGCYVEMSVGLDSSCSDPIGTAGVVVMP